MARMSLLQVGRLVALFLVTFFASIVLGINAQLLSTFGSLVLPVVLSVAVSAATVLTFPIMVIIDIFHHKVPMTSYIVVELGWHGILGVLWLATAVWLPHGLAEMSCGTQTCLPHFQVSRVFAFLSFITLLVYTATLLIKAVVLRRTSDRPARIWTGSVREVFSPNRLRMTIVHMPISPSKTGFGFVVEQDDDPFHPEPVSSRSPSMFLPNGPSSPMSAKSPAAQLLSPMSPIAVSLPSPVSPAYLQV